VWPRLPHDFDGVRNILFCIITVAFCLSFRPAYAQKGIFTPILTTVQNFRDLAGISAGNGGTGFANTTSNNGVMRTGVFYRSDLLARNGAFPVSNTDWAAISSLHIGRDIDLRTPAEITQTPDRSPSGATYTNINIFGTPTEPVGPPWTVQPSEMSNYMKGLYHDFGADPAQRAALGKVLLTLAHDGTPDLYHCSAGKDRTGWTSAILESIAGVSSATIMKDYLATNSYMRNLINTMTQLIQQQYPTAQLATIDAGLKVTPEYLNTALNQVIASYGSMYAYLTQGLGLSPADIYVLRAKMVYYLTLPGQNGFVGNAAAGAGVLNALQNSPLSGRYTAFNYYLQSAIDAGTLGGVQDQVGGQVYADAASFLSRRSQWIDEAVRPYTSGRDLGAGQTCIWMAGRGGGFWTSGSSEAASSTESNAGTLLGATHRFNDHACADLGIGYNWGAVGSAGASATVNTVLTTIGGRYGFTGLETGPFVTARADAGYVDCGCTRPLGGGLGRATGKTNGAFYGGRAGLGDVFRAAPFTFTVQAGARFTGVSLSSFNESGSELALGVNAINKTYSSLLFDLGVSLDRRQLGAWTIAPALALGYERVLANPRVQSTGTVYGYSVIQYSAFDSRDLTKAGLTVTAQRGAFMVTAEMNSLIGGAAKSAGINGQLSVNYRF
jgi:protein-tyrosine phosphatase